MTDLVINYGGIYLDVDDSSIGGFEKQTLWDFGKSDTKGKGRSLDLSVPATTKNTKALNFYKLLPADGVRRGLEGSVLCGGVAIDGTIFVTGYSSGRYNLMIAYGRSFRGFAGNNYAFADTITYNSQDVPITGGNIPDFGWYEYGNWFSPHATVGIIAEMFPSTNLGYVINTLATAAGYTVNYPAASLGRQYQADAYGLILPSFGLQGVNHQVDITGSAYYGYTATVPGGTLADAGLEMSTAFMKRGQIPQSVKVNVFRTLRDVQVTLPPNSGVVMVGGDGYTIYNDWNGLQGVSFRFRSGAIFALVRANEWHTSGKNNYWNRTESPRAYEGNIGTVSLQTAYGAFEFPQNGDTLSIASALPAKTLEEWLDVYCNMIAGVWTVDDATKEITIKTYSELITAAYGDTAHHIVLEDEKVTAIESVTRYVDGFAQHNYTRTTEKPNYYTRDLQCYNDYLQQEKELAEIPISAGDRMGSSDDSVTRTLVDDVRQDESGTFVYNGDLTIFFENTVTNDGARHIADTLNMGIGEDLQSLVANSSSVSVRMLMPLFKFAKINELTCASLHGRNFVVQSAKWDKGAAQLQLLDVGEVLPQMSYNYLNFFMPNGGNITLTRNGNPTPVTLEYSLDGGDTWTTWSEVGNVRTLTLAAGGRVWLRNASNTSTGFSTSGMAYYNFAFTDIVYAYGDTRSILCSIPFNAQLSDYVFSILFEGCSTLMTAPELPAMSLATGCYNGMFTDCSSLVTAPELPAMSLAESCYDNMFNGCSSLVSAPELPAMSLANYCYYGMFAYCSSLVNAPELPAMSLAESCYYNMFTDCSSLVTAPELPAMSLANHCYYGMFYGCSSLVNAPELPAMSLAISCYYGMFDHCTSLVNAPELPAMSLASYCYYGMFYGCTSLNNVTMLATDISATNCLNNWLNNVAAAGTLHTDSSLTDIPVNSPSGIPTGWTREDVDPWINFAMPNGGDITLTRNGSPTPVVLEYSTDGGLNWSEWVEVGNVRTLTLQAGGRVWLRNQSAESTGFSTSDTDYYRFSFTDAVYAYGDTRSLLCSNVIDAVFVYYVFCRLFYGCATLMTAPRLEALILARYCYSYMFYACTSLVVAPELPSPWTYQYCYQSMFQGCTALTVAPILNAPTIYASAYRRMFYGCSSLNLVVLYATTASASYCTYQWLTGVAATGDLYCPQSLVFTSTDGGVPSGWTRHDL